MDLLIYLLIVCIAGFGALQLAVDRTLLSLYANISTIFEPTLAQFDFEEPPIWKRTLSLSGTFQVIGSLFIIIALYASIFRYEFYLLLTMFLFVC